MVRRLGSWLIALALLSAAVGVQGASVASAQTGPIGYTVGARLNEADCHFYAVDLPTGEATQVSTDPVPCADGLTFAPDGTLYAVQRVGAGPTFDANLVTIDPTDGTQQIVGALPPVQYLALGMTFDAAGELWLYGAAPGNADCLAFASLTCLWRVDPADASAEIVGGAPASLFVFGLAGSCDGEVVAITVFATGNGGTALQRVDTGNGALDQIVILPDVPVPEGLDYSADGRLWSIGLPGDGGQALVFLIDPASGDATQTGITVGGDPLEATLAGLAVDPITCPEPEPPPTPEPIVLEPTFTG